MWQNNTMQNVTVVKIGTHAIIDQNGDVDLEVIENLAVDIEKIRAGGKHILLVTSGAVGAGHSSVDRQDFGRISQMEFAQIQSSVGQPLLMKCFKNIFEKHDINIAQGLITRSDFANRERQIAMKSILEKMLLGGVLPVLNENDFLTPEELDFSDNDQLASFVAGMLQADMLVMLSNVDGLFTKDPKYTDSKRVEIVRDITEEIEGYVSEKKSEHGLGGMASKIEAAKLLNKLGIDMVLANSREENVLQKIFDEGKVGTKFLAESDNKKSSIRTWLAAGAAEHGSVILDCPATKIFGEKKYGTSILGVGVARVDGEFEAGLPIAVVGDSGKQLGRGVAKISATDMKKLVKSSNLKGKIFVHADGLFLF